MTKQNKIMDELKQAFPKEIQSPLLQIISKQVEEIEGLNNKIKNLENHNEKLHEIAEMAVDNYEYAKRKATEYNQICINQKEELEVIKTEIFKFTERFPLPDIEWIYARDAHEHFEKFIEKEDNL